MGPCLRSLKISAVFIRTCYTVGLGAVCGPIAETYGLLLSKIKIRFQKIDEKEDKDIFVA